ncbi:MAG: rod shape-determining protein MreD [Pseudomonadota bacterium]|nr:rod shape-determining protein MreD [Pseudomonadota bacterium]
MITATLQRLDRSVRQMVPFVLSIFLVMVAVLPVYVSGYGQIAIDVGLMAVFYWAIFRPDLFPVMAAFGLGLWQEIIVGGPIGVQCLMLLLTYWVIVSQRRFFQGKSFYVIWWSFSVVTIFVASLSWVIVCTLNITLISPFPILFQMLLTIGVFPFVAWFLARVQHAILRPIDA